MASKSPGFNIIEEYTLDENIDSNNQVINTDKVSLDATGNVVTSGGDDNVESVRQMINNYPVKETAEIKLEARNPASQSHCMW